MAKETRGFGGSARGGAKRTGKTGQVVNSGNKTKPPEPESPKPKPEEPKT